MNRLKTPLCAALCAALLMSSLPPATAQLPAEIGSALREQDTPLGDGLSYRTNTVGHAAAGRIEERILVRDAASPVTPVVVGGQYIYNSNLTLSQAAAKLSAAGETVVGGVTGDMFSVSTGVALGLVVRDGVLRACDNDMSALGLLADGTAVIGVPNLVTTLSAGGTPIVIDRVNRVRDVNKLYLYTEDFSTDTRTTKQGTHVVLTVGGQLTIGGTVTGVVKEIVSGTAAYPLKHGEMVLSASSAEPIARLAGLVPGAAVSLSVTASDPVWNDVKYASGGMHRLVSKGTPVAGLGSDRAPRTAAGVLPDGGLVLYAVDGRQSGYSNGLSLTEVAARMISLGCVDALEMDGGGSTAAGVVLPGQAGFSVVNKPSDGQERKCTGYLFFVNRVPATGAAARLFVRGTEQALLVGAQTRLSVTAADSAWHPYPAPQSPVWSSTGSAVGTVDAAGLFTAVTAGTTGVVAQAWGLTASRDITVVDTADTLKIIGEADKSTVTSLSGNPGKTVALQAVCTYASFPLVTQDVLFTWTVTGDVGTVSADGSFTFGPRVGASGKLTVTGGGRALDIPVTVGTAPVVAESFENGAPAFGASGSGMIFSQDISIKLAGRGVKSGRVDYAFTPTADGTSPPGALSLPASVALNGSPKYLYLLLAGDGSKNKLFVSFALKNGQTATVAAGTLESKNYRSVHLDVPAGAVMLSGLSLECGGTPAGSFHIDHLVSAWSLRDDQNPPLIEIAPPDTAALPGSLLYTVTVKDDTGVALPRANLSVMWDGAALDFGYDVYSGTLTVAVPDPVTDLHILSVTAWDVFGNRRKLSAQVARPRADNLDKFYDVKGGWMEPYADFLDGKGVLAARESDGLRYFDPGQALTRLEMVELVVRLMGLNTAAYENTVLPFTDAAQIPAAALPAVKAAYALGIVSGMGSAGGMVKLGGALPITRQDFCVIVLGAVPKGFTRAVKGFADAARISPYAVEAVETFVGLGAISGTDRNTFEPSRTISRGEAAAVLTKLFF